MRLAPGATPLLAPPEASPFPAIVPAQCVPCPLDVSVFSASVLVQIDDGEEGKAFRVELGGGDAVTGGDLGAAGISAIYVSELGELISTQQ